MTISLFDLFKIGIGPSSSHTVGPMWAAHRFLGTLAERDLTTATARVEVHLYGSLALTGKGHATDKAIMLGLMGHRPDQIDPDVAATLFADALETGHLAFAGGASIPFAEGAELLFKFGERLDHHSNGMRFIAFDGAGNASLDEIYYSVGGGFILSDAEVQAASQTTSTVTVPYPFHSGADLLQACGASGLTIAEIALANERVFRPDQDIRPGLLEICAAMDASIERGCRTDGILPGGLKVRRRAKALKEELDLGVGANADVLGAMDWVSLFALAGNEENAAGGRVVTAPTNGAAGIIPATLAYYKKFVPGANEDGVVTFMATAGAIGMLYKRNASISAAEVGCQGEVGVACSMAAAGLAAIMGGTPEQVENAAEIGMEHNLGLTCDPIKGLVQIPCIERNTMGAIKAINAAKLAMRGDGRHVVSLDAVIETMRQTGRDMSERYKETAEAGLAVNVVEC
jgi:L-serine dehydratase